MKSDAVFMQPYTKDCVVAERPPTGQILFKQLTNNIRKSGWGGTNKYVNKTHH